MPTTLAFKTPPEGVKVPVGAPQPLGSVTVQPFSKIRVIVSKGADSDRASTVTVHLIIRTEDGTHIGPLDTLLFTETSSVSISKVYEVPGTHLAIAAEVKGSSRPAQIFAYVYGS